MLYTVNKKYSMILEETVGEVESLKRNGVISKSAGRIDICIIFAVSKEPFHPQTFSCGYILSRKVNT